MSILRFDNVSYQYPGESFDIMWLVNALVWLVLFIAGTTWAFRRDTKRV